MASITSVGIGSGLDVKSIVSQLVDLERKPLDTLKIKAATVSAKISAFGQIKSLVSTLQDSVSKLASVTGWNGVTATSSNTAVVTVSATGGTQPGSFNVEVQRLAQAQAWSSDAVASGSALGAGTLRLEQGEWGEDGSFTPASAASAWGIEVKSGDTVADVASKINGANTGVTATVLTDGTGKQRLLLNSKATGELAGFRVSVDEGGASALSALASGGSITQSGQGAKATVNGVEVRSSSNQFADTVPGVTFTALAVTSGPANLAIANDTAAIKANLGAFVSAYNALNDYINQGTSYDAEGKTSGLLQADSATVSLQNTLRAALQSVTAGGGMSRLADVGISIERGDRVSADSTTLVIDSTKLDAALGNLDAVKYLFRGTDESVSDGFAEKFKAVTNSLLATGGLIATKNQALEKQSEANAAEQDDVEAKATNLETRLNARYAALDAQMASLNALNAYITQQVATWNKSTS